MSEDNRTLLFRDLQNIVTQYCEGCFLYQHLRETEGKRAAHRFCIKQCTVGDALKEYGKKLS